MAMLLTFILALAPAAGAARSAPEGESYTATSTLEARDQPAGKRLMFRLAPGQEYRLLKRGGPGGQWCKLEAADGKQGWVECRREPMPHAGEPAAEPRPASCPTRCAQPPLLSTSIELTPLDREVLSLCPARPDASVSREDVRRFIRAHAGDPRVQRAFSAAGRPGSGGGGLEANVDWLTSLLVSSGPRNAFTHIFCGDDWTTDKLGGLHYLPRYAQLEREGKVCYDGPARGGSAQQGGQYLIRYHGVSPWSCGVKHLGGMPEEHDPVQLLATATRAFVRCCGRDGQQREGGVYTAADLGGLRWRVWCNDRNGTYGIATLYPTDEQATCRD